ncbi:MAG TPA: hypothetical protein VJO35_02295 [Terriglobales bacterium]|nr:hypothetical protein [Terriglobales bacterium]
MKRVMALALTLTLLECAAQAQQSTATATAKTTKRRAAATRIDSDIAAQLSQLRQALDAQQEQIKQLSQQLQSRDQQLQELQQQMSRSQSAATEAQSKADVAASQSSEQQQTVTSLKSDVADLKNNVTNSAVALQETQKNLREAIESPLAIHYKGVSITPVGFFAAESVWRQHALGADINTPFNSINMPGADADHLSEFFGSGRQSRVGMLAQGKTNIATLTGYVEADFLSAGITSNNNQSNSYSLRQRQIWGQATLNDGFSFTGGQMWSLVTETRKALDNRTEVLPMTIDPQYNVGFSWARQYGFRVVKNFANKFWLGGSVENAQGLFSASGQAQNFLLGSAGTGGGLYNGSATYTFNPSPDFIFKAAAEPGFGHFELFGVIRDFRDRVYPGGTGASPAPVAVGAYNFSTHAAGVGANARISILHKHVDLAGHFLGGDGMGRYGSSTLPDVTVNPNGTLALLKSYQGLGTLEFHYPKLDVYFNVGGEFVGRHYEFNGKGAAVGYGSPTANNSGCYVEVDPGSPTGGQFPTSSSGFLPASPGNCTANTRNVIEGTAGFWYRFYKGPKGTVQWGPQYSYFMRNTWEACGAAALTGPCVESHFTQPHGVENIFLTSLRYYLP